MKQRTILITGAAGFIGSHLSDAFLRDGCRVIGVDNYITGSTENLAHIKNEPRFVFIEQDVTLHMDIKDDVDFILHFASPASPIDYAHLPIQTLKVGALGTHNALGLARVKKSGFLLASTSEVYGDPLVHPQKEDYWGNVNPIGPRGVYDEAKRFAEAIATAYYRVHHVNVKIVRIFNTYGPRMRLKDGRAIPEFITQALSGKPLPIFGSGSQTRSFCYVDDLVEGIMRMMASNLNEPVNLGNPNEMTILQLAQTIIKMTNSHSTIEYHALPQDDPKVRQPDISKARRELSWLPKTTLETGLKKTLAYFESRIKLTQ